MVLELSTFQGNAVAEDLPRIWTNNQMILFSTFFFFSSSVSVSLQSWDRVAVIWIVNTAIKKAKRTDAVVSSSRTSIGDVSLLCSIPPFSA